MAITLHWPRPSSIHLIPSPLDVRISSTILVSSTTCTCSASAAATTPARRKRVAADGGAGGVSPALTRTREDLSSALPGGSAAVGGGGVVVSSSLARKIAESQLAPAPIARLTGGVAPALTRTTEGRSSALAGGASGVSLTITLTREVRSCGGCAPAPSLTVSVTMEDRAAEVLPSPSPSCSGVDCSAGTGREAAPPAERAPLRAGVEKAPREIATLDSLGAAWASSLRSARLLSRLTVRPMCPPCACSSSAMAASSTTLPCVEVWMPRAASCVRTRPTPFAAAAEVVEEAGGGG
eukprot:scaffold27985_cov46-Phaeocystis_antarctica.AAC.1